ncbi:hypothetical protein WJX72_000578 [[Myrmecia] bisecta]|uniref:Uncharacterized protein n=1 Tax=[Myrmecia] bisecta TaxID=41462 RepID=A0AAW1R476_9CHLO
MKLGLVAFTTAIAALVIVTLGVLYLSLSQYLDTRKEREDRESYEQSLKDREYAKSVAPKAGAKAGKPVKRKKVSSKGGKGFGK